MAQSVERGRMKKDLRNVTVMPMSKWTIRQNRKEPNYFCNNCLNSFRTGRLSFWDGIYYDDICPYCGAIGMDFQELVREYKLLAELYNNLVKNKDKTLK